MFPWIPVTSMALFFLAHCVVFLSSFFSVVKQKSTVVDVTVAVSVVCKEEEEEEEKGKGKKKVGKIKGESVSSRLKALK
jgi:hypothetical protein